MIEEKTFSIGKKEQSKLKIITAESAEQKNNGRKIYFYIVLILPALFMLTALAYGFANGNIQVNFASGKHRTDDLRKQTEELQSKIAEISIQKELAERKRNKILDQLSKTKSLLEKSKNSSAEVDAHIQVLTSTCISCPPPAWVESYKATADILGEIERILNEDN